MVAKIADSYERTIAGSNPVLTTNMGTLMEGGNKTHNMVRSGVTEWLMAPLAGLGSSPNVSTT